MLRAKEVLAPGIWVDADDAMHFSIPDLLDFFGWPHDEEHKAGVENVIRQIAAAKFPTVPISQPRCPNCGLVGRGPHKKECPLR